MFIIEKIIIIKLIAIVVTIFMQLTIIIITAVFNYLKFELNFIPSIIENFIIVIDFTAYFNSFLITNFLSAVIVFKNKFTYQTTIKFAILIYFKIFLWSDQDYYQHYFLLF